MTRSTSRRVRLEVLLLVAVCAVTAALLAAPGLAGAANQTEIKAKAQPSTVTWGQRTVLTGTLMDLDTMTAVGGQWLRVESSPTGLPDSWVLLAAVTTEGDAEYATGQYTLRVQPLKLTYYQYVFGGTTTLAASTSNPVKVKVRPYLGRPLQAHARCSKGSALQRARLAQAALPRTGQDRQGQGVPVQEPQVESWSSASRRPTPTAASTASTC